MPKLDNVSDREVVAGVRSGRSSLDSPGTLSLMSPTSDAECKVGDIMMIKRFPSYGAMDAFLWSNQLILIQCWPEKNGEWVVKFKA